MPKYMRNKFLFAVFASIILIIPQAAYSENKTPLPSANAHLPAKIKAVSDYRVKILEKYFKEQNSPLEPYAKDFVANADKYNIDWRLVAAISGVESTFGKAIPSFSYNAWGWGIYGDKVTRFSSWNQGIETVSAGLRQSYMDKIGGDDIYQIGSMYAASPFWAGHVMLYINNINDFALRDPKDTLSLSL